MNILMCLSRMIPGGAETHVLTLACAMKRMGHRVAVISSGGALTKELEKAGIEHVTAPLDKKDAFSLLRSSKILSASASHIKADIIHAHGRIPAFVCGMLRNRPGFPPVITTAHGYWDPLPPKGSLSYWGDSTIAVSSSLSSWLSDKYGKAISEITVIPNGVDIPHQPHALKDDPRLVRLTAACRLDSDNAASVKMLCEAAVALNDKNSGRRGKPKIRLSVYGDGNCAEKLRLYSEELMKKAGQSGTVLFPGQVTEPSAYLKDTDIFAGSSRSAIEAAAAGIPVILLSGSGICGGILSESTADAAYESNFIPGGRDSGQPSDSPRSGSASLLSFCIKLLTDDEGLRKEAGAFARNYVLLRCNINDTAEKTLKVYREILKRKKSRIVLCGYFGASNAGDDASLEAVAAGLEKEGMPRESISVIARRSGFRKIASAGLKPLPRLNPFLPTSELKKAGLFVLCGGSLIQDATSRRSLAYYARTVKAASVYGCRIMLLGQGLGPLKRKGSERAAAGILALSDAAGFRDEASLHYAEELIRKYIPKDGGRNFFLSCDAALKVPKCESFNSNDSASPCEETNAGENDNVGKYSVIIPKSMRGRCRRDERTMLRSLSAAAARSAEGGVRPLTAALFPGDAAAARKIAAVGGGRFAGTLGAEAAEKLLAGAEYSISVRLHGAVFSVSSGTPAVCIAYDPKVSAFASEMGLPCIGADGITPEALLSAVDRLPDFGKDVLPRIKNAVERQKKDIDAALRLINYLPI